MLVCSFQVLQCSWCRKGCTPREKNGYETSKWNPQWLFFKLQWRLSQEKCIKTILLLQMFLFSLEESRDGEVDQFIHICMHGAYLGNLLEVTALTVWSLVHRSQSNGWTWKPCSKMSKHCNLSFKCQFKMSHFRRSWILEWLTSTVFEGFPMGWHRQLSISYWGLVSSCYGHYCVVPVMSMYSKLILEW